MTPRSQSPRANELELSLLGPGLGEAVVVHLGQGEWLLVDSCRSGSSTPASMEYLTQLGVPTSAVKSIVVTHWHDDHILGVADLAGHYSQATVHCSAALEKREFFQRIVAAEVRGGIAAAKQTTGFDEFAQLYRLWNQREKAGAHAHLSTPHWTKESTVVYRRQSSKACPGCEVIALSPSSQCVTKGLRALIGPAVGPRGLPSIPRALGPNATSIVLAVTFGSRRLLLGGDLEETSSPGMGWNGVLAVATLPGGASDAFKVPHHGSRNGHNAEVWKSMLNPRRLAVLTTFNPSRLPTDADLRRLKRVASEVYCTTRPGGWSPPRRDSTVEKTTREVVKNHRRVKGVVGHVRLRTDVLAATCAFSVDLFAQAYRA
jgi:beta-lactamase superfamily II metal-dependent hydrolase